jgi:hypothetical protein
MTTFLSKLRAEDTPVLRKLATQSKLAHHVRVAYRRRQRGIELSISSEITPGTTELDWEKRALMAMGLKLGGKDAMTPTGRAILKGLNVFPSGLRGEPMGFWDGSTVPQSMGIYSYESLFEPGCLFVSRELAQLPTICRVPQDIVFNNTVILIHLKERFPLHGWVLSLPVMYMAALCLRATVIEDLGCHWYPKNLRLLPMPSGWTPNQLDDLERCSANLLKADDDLAAGSRAVNDLIEHAACQSVSQQIARGMPLTSGVILPTPDEPLPEELQLGHGGLVDSQGNLVMHVPDSDLSEVLLYLFEKEVDGSEDEQTADVLANLKIPTDASVVAQAASAIRDLENDQAQLDFNAGRKALDEYAADLLTLTPNELDYIRERMSTDDFLKQLRPMWAHRGLHAQTYHDHSGGDRFAH